MDYIPIIHTSLEFNLVQNDVGGQVKEVEKVTPIGKGGRSQWGNV